jgi:hypothetical protein
VLGDYAELSGARIADEAGREVEDFFAQFADRDACYAAAQDSVAADLLAALAAVPAAASWPASARERLRALLAHLTERPLAAHTIALGAFAPGGRAAQRNRRLSLAVAEELLRDSGGGDRACALAGAIWHVIGTQAAGGRLQLLPALRDHLAYVAVAAVRGPDAAAAALAEDLGDASRAGGG